jgi:hypothetical protein
VDVVKLQNVTVRDRSRKLVSLPWKMIGPTFGSVRFSHAELGAVVLIARTPDRAGTVCSFKGPAVFDVQHSDIAEAARRAFAAFREKAGDVLTTTGGTVAATIPPDAMKTVRDVAKAADEDGPRGGLYFAGSMAYGTDGGSVFAADVPGLSVAGQAAVCLPLAGLPTFAGGELLRDGSKIAAGGWIGEDRSDRAPRFGDVLRKLDDAGGWSIAVDGRALLSALKSAGSDVVGLQIENRQLVVAGESAHIVVDVVGAGNPAFAARWNANRLRKALGFVGGKGTVRLKTAPGLIRLEGDAEDRCAMVGTVVEKKP